MPISSDPGARARQLAQLNPKLPPSHRATKSVRHTLPVELADLYESLTKPERDMLLERALRELLEIDTPH